MMIDAGNSNSSCTVSRYRRVIQHARPENMDGKAIAKLAIDLHLYEIAFKAGYEGSVSRPLSSRRLVRKSAKKHPDGLHIGERARRDIGFCAHLAPIVHAV